MVIFSNMIQSQMRLNAFFSKPATTVTKAASPVPSSPQKEVVQKPANIESPAKPQNTRSDYRKEFPVFFLQSHTHVSPPHQFQRDGEALNHIQQKLDSYLKHPTALPSYRGSELFDVIPYQRRKGTKVVPVKTTLAKAQNADPTASTTALRDELKKVTMKSLRFGEDVRPPYYGTFTKQLSKTQAHKVCRTPYARVLPEVNYDYDSEAEWEEPEEGEDLDSEGEEDASDDGEDDMDEFLDDEDEQMDSRRRLIIGDQEPICTGIRWQDGKSVDPDMEVYRIEALSGIYSLYFHFPRLQDALNPCTDTIQLPIDPFSTAYWPKPKAVEQAAPKASSSLPPARATLHAYSVNPSTSTYTPSPLAPPARPATITDNKAVSKAKKPFPPENMEEFKQTVEGCDLSKAGLIEVLKKR
jgi:chromatin assembly factor 1 subunit A